MVAHAYNPSIQEAAGRPLKQGQAGPSQTKTQVLSYYYHVSWAKEILHSCLFFFSSLSSPFP